MAHLVLSIIFCVQRLSVSIKQGSCCHLCILLCLGCHGHNSNDAESYITLPYVALSILFNFGLMIGFLYKLSQLLTDMQLSGTQDLSAERPNKNVIDPLLITMTKNTLLAVISISCTFLVIIVLIYLYIRNDGEYKKHSITEEFILEFAILVDIVSNFICVLLSYHFFDFEYRGCAFKNLAHK